MKFKVKFEVTADVDCDNEKAANEIFAESIMGQAVFEGMGASVDIGGYSYKSKNVKLISITKARSR